MTSNAVRVGKGEVSTAAAGPSAKMGARVARSTVGRDDGRGGRMPSWARRGGSEAGGMRHLAALAAAAGLALVGSLAVAGSASPWLSAVSLVSAALLAVLAFGDMQRAARTEAEASDAAPVPEHRSADPLAAALARTRIQELTTEVQRLRATEAELLDAKRSAESAALAKGEFLATMSHEVRTPLNGILPILELVLGSSVDGEVRHQVSAALDSAREMRRIVNDVLDYSKLESGKLQLEVSSFRPIEVIESVCTMMKRSAEAKHLRLVCTIDRSVPPIVRGDSLRLRQVLTNIVSNAVKFTAKGEVVVEVAQVSEDRAHRTIRIAVRDSGPGISPEASSRLFQPFSQADASTARAHGGTGLGLAICRRVIESMSGKIGVESAVGRGSTFWFTIPLLRAPGEVAPLGVAEEFDAILLTRDDVVAELWMRHLDASGSGVSRAGTAYEVLSMLRARSEMGRSPDLVVVDLASANKTASSVVRTVRSEKALSGIRLLMLGEPVDGIANDDGAGPLTFVSRDPGDAAALRVVQALLAGDKVAEAGPELKIADEPLGSFCGIRALLVDDIAINRYAGQKTLEKLGAEVTLASGGREAIELMKSRAFDVVLLDCQMPDVDGYTAARVMRLHEREHQLPRVPILAITANAMPGDRELCLEAGMDDHLAKPIELVPLSRMLTRWAGTRLPASDVAVTRTAEKRVPGVAQTAVKPIAEMGEVRNVHALC